MNNALYEPEGKTYLVNEYIDNGRSTYDIAKDCSTYANDVRKALKFHGIPLRNKADAQSKALKAGRHKHPTQGKVRPNETKIKISNKLASTWDEMTDEEKKERSDNGKKLWKKMTPKQRESLQKMAHDAIRVTTKEGSRLEKYLLLGLKTAGYKAEFHKEFLIDNEKMHVDIFLPNERIAIEIDGPSHYFPIWGEEQLAKTIYADTRKNGLLIQKGYKVIRIKHLTKNISEHTLRTSLKNLLNCLKDFNSDLLEIEG